MEMEQWKGLTVYPSSVVEVDGTTFFLARDQRVYGSVGDPVDGQILGIQGDWTGFEGTRDVPSGALICPLTAANAAALRDRLSWLRPQPLGLRTSVGLGDRLGLATPGHIRALRRVPGIAPVLAQQSMRENARTGRSPQRVMDDALWGIFQEGWRDPWGADADHLKSVDDVDLCVAAGYTFYTIDPGDHVDDSAHGAPLSALEDKAHDLPWGQLEATAEGLRSRYLGRCFDVEEYGIEFDQITLVRALVKYGRAIAHTVLMYRHLASKTIDFELEMSVDETESPTSLAEHYFIATELKRLGVQWVSLAPRYLGRFEKGVDYIGSLAELETELAQHAAIARVLGPYKLSIHSGSDKFRIYPAFARFTRGHVHLKTAGTSYLEALRTVAEVEPALFREIYSYALGRYPGERATYHVSAELANAPEPKNLADGDLSHLLDQFDTRQILHVTFGSVLERFGPAFLAVLVTNEEAHYQALETHIERHLVPFWEQERRD